MNFLYEPRFVSFYFVHVTRKKLPKQRSYEKFVRKMLMKLTLEVGQTEEGEKSNFVQGQTVRDSDSTFICQIQSKIKIISTNIGHLFS